MDRILCNRRGELHVRPLESRELAPGEVRLRLECAAVLPGETFPILRDRVPGRFFCATVEECAPDCFRILEGDRVTVCPVPEPGIRTGFETDGCWQDEMIVPESWAIQLPDSPDDAVCAMFAPLAGLAELLLQVPGPYGMPLGIAGGDVVGSLALQAAAAMGFSPVCVIDPSEAYRRRAVSLGADFTLNPLNEHALGRLKNLTEDGFPVFLEAGEGEKRSEFAADGLKDGGKLLLFDLMGDAPAQDPDRVRTAEQRAIRTCSVDLSSQVLSPEAVRCARWILEKRTPDLEGLIDRQISLSALPGAWDDARMGLVRGAILVRPES